MILGYEELRPADLADGTSPSPQLTAEAFQSAIEGIFRPFRDAETLRTVMDRLANHGLAEPPFPGSGATLERWKALAAVAAIDLPLAKVYEGHTDALAILAELNTPKAPGLWAVWASEPPGLRVIFRPENGGRISGRKAWCSGASVVDHAVISAWTEAGQPILVKVAMRQPGITVDNSGWVAVGMNASQSGTVRFENVKAEPVGREGDYVARPGFWQGGAGIAAVWFGGASAIAGTLATSKRVGGDDHAAAHLGAIDVALQAARALLVETAAWIDAHPTADASAHALRVRACVEAAANDVLLRTGRALGPGPLCSDAEHAQRCADLTVFLRQSHAEHDLTSLGRMIAGNPAAWNL